EVGRMRRTLGLANQAEDGLEDAERERVSSTLSLQGKQAKIPSDKLVLIEGFENSVIVHTCAGNLVNEALANAMAALFGSRLGSNIATQVDQYRFGLIFPRPVSAHMVAEEFKANTERLGINDSRDSGGVRSVRLEALACTPTHWCSQSTGRVQSPTGPVIG